MRPLEMARMWIYIDQELTSNLINFLPTLNYIQVKDLDKSLEDISLSQTYLFLEQLKSDLRKVDAIEGDLNVISSALADCQVDVRSYEGKVHYATQSIGNLIDIVALETRSLRHDVEILQEEIHDTEIEREKLRVEIELLRILSQFQMEPEFLSKLRYFSILAFSVIPDNVEKIQIALAKSDLTNFFYYDPEAQIRSICFLICKREDESRIRNAIIPANPEFIEIPIKYITPNGVDLVRAQRDFEEVTQKVESAQGQFKASCIESIEKVLAFHEILMNLKRFLVIERQFLFVPPNTAILEIWTPAEEVPNVTNKLHEMFNDKVRVRVKEMTFSEVPYEKGYGQEGKTDPLEEIPTLTKHSKFVAPFQTLLRLYGHPGYTEIDPTIFLAITFPLFFGIMFADVGHGIVLVIVGLIGRYLLRKRSQGTRDMTIIIIYCGLGAILGGFFAGEFFGNRISTIPYLEWATALNIFQDPLQNVIFILKICIIIGVVQICLGWLLQAINYYFAQRKYLALTDSGLKIVLLVAGTVLIFHFGLNINVWLSGPVPPILLPLIPGLSLIFMRAIGKALHLNYLAKESYGQVLGESTIQTMETLLNVISNVASYSRLLAMMAAHIGLMLVVKLSADMTAAEFSGAPVLGAVIVTLGVVLGNALVMLLESVLVFIQDMRLHFYEFFSKFYKGTGVPFIPVQFESTYSDIEFEPREEMPILVRA
jgi:V/A-type H+-transporting ATPase subunit I